MKVWLAYRPHNIHHFMTWARGTHSVKMSANSLPISHGMCKLHYLQACLWWCLCLCQHVFILSCWARLWTILMTKLWSLISFIGTCKSIFHPRNLTHILSPLLTPKDRCLSSASTLDLEIVFCFLLLYDTRFDPKIFCSTEVDLWSANELGSFASLNKVKKRVFPLEGWSED